MVYLALTPDGLQELLLDLPNPEIPIWCSSDALSEAEFRKLERVNVTRFNCSLLGADNMAMSDALATIEEHHPGERIWIESIITSSSARG
jgi:hypothetical protein